MRIFRKKDSKTPNDTWKEIYKDFGVKNHQELEQKLNRATTDWIVDFLKSRKVRFDEILEILCIGCIPYTEENYKAMVKRIEEHTYEYKEAEPFESTTDYLLVYQVSTKDALYILIQIMPYEMYDNKKVLYFEQVHQRFESDHIPSHYHIYENIDK